MKPWIVTKTYKYTETVEVEAETAEEACSLADSLEGQRNHDDWHFDSVAKEGKPS